MNLYYVAWGVLVVLGVGGLIVLVALTALLIKVLK